jgi:hypothetical protein
MAAVRIWWRSPCQLIQETDGRVIRDGRYKE